MTWLLIDYAFIIFYPEFFFKESFRKAGGKYFTDSSRSQKHPDCSVRSGAKHHEVAARVSSQI